MIYVSTRGRAPELGFADVLLAGLASDGGLYVPAEWPMLPPPVELDAAVSYAETAHRVITPFVGGHGSYTSRPRNVYQTTTRVDV